MKANEALKIIDKVHDYPCPYGIGGTAWQFIRSCIEKQIPKKPVIKFGKKPVTHNYGRLMQFFCPRCGRHIIAMYETDVLRGGGISNDVKGCCSCLQRIDFSGYYHKGGEEDA